MTISITGAVVGIASAGVSIGTTAAKLAKGSGSSGPTEDANGNPITSRSTSQQEFPEATRKLIQSTEFPLLAGFLGDQASRASLLGSNVNTNPFAQKQYGEAAPALAQAASKKGAEQAGIADLGPIDATVSGLGPELTNALHQITLAQGAKGQGVVQPGYANFLAPGSFSSSEKVAQFNPFQTGMQLGSGLTGIAAGIQGLSSDTTT